MINNMNILIVDDVIENCLLLEKFLTIEGFTSVSYNRPFW